MGGDRRNFVRHRWPTAQATGDGQASQFRSSARAAQRSTSTAGDIFIRARIFRSSCVAVSRSTIPRLISNMRHMINMVLPLFVFLLVGGVQAFHFDKRMLCEERLPAAADHFDTASRRRSKTAVYSNTRKYDKSIDVCQNSVEVAEENRSRRDVLSICARATFGAAILSFGMPFASPAQAAAASGGDFAALRDKVTEARRQLDPVPNLIKEEKWDSIRAILITPPLSDCWGKSSGANPLLRNYAEAVGDQGGDELAALEAREEALDHLRFLDMAAYNNVFNPIKTEGETGATKGLIKSYYEDPVNELKASTAALDELVKLGEI